MKKISYQPEGVCSHTIEVELKEGRIAGLKFIGGCPGNALGLSKLVIGMTPGEVIERLSGIRCGGKMTSCPDQLSQALVKHLKDLES
jgi:uncharacterized protein (TIGR03905 family)